MARILLWRPVIQSHLRPREQREQGSTLSDVLAASTTVAPGCCLGPYRVLEPIGKDKSEAIYRARDTRVNRAVLVRVISVDPLRRAALLRNAAVAASFSHPNFVRLVEIGASEDHGQLYLISEWVSGESLRSMLNARRYSPRRSIDLTIQLAEALADAHAADFVHADLKPEDIIVTPKGDARILHLGLATGKAADRDRHADGYMAPERVLGEGIDCRTDVFSLGAMLFEMLTGDPPPVASAAVHHSANLTTRTVPSSISGQRLSAELRATLATALAGNLDARCGSAAAFAAELRAVAAILDLRARASANVPVV